MLKDKKLLALILCLFALGLGLSFGYIAGLNNYKNSKSYISSNNIKSFAPVVSESKKAVVNVFSEKTLRNRTMSFESLFFDIFGNVKTPFEEVQKGQGSGVIISPDGYIVTNYHVVQNADKVKVVLSDGEEIEAKIIGSDQKTDLMLLKIPKPKLRNYPYMSFSNSDKVTVGDVVLAIGNPYGLGQTITMGIVSALNRENIGLVENESYIQTDAAINPGNSGGALIDSAGQLIGINTGLYSRNGGYQGIGFAVPSNQANYVIEQIKKHGTVERVSLGITVSDISVYSNHPIVSSFAQSKYRKGAFVLSVKPNGLAHKNNIQPESLIIEFNNKKIDSAMQLIKEINKLKVSQPIQIKLVTVDFKTGNFEEKTINIQN